MGPPSGKVEKADIPTFDVGDLEKKSPEELDALLRQLDEYGQKNKKAMDDYSAASSTKQEQHVPKTTIRNQQP